jgi:transcriptional regulator with XRE-family HTH domain
MEVKAKVEDVRRLLLEGYTVKEIAEKLGVSKTRIYQITYSKLLRSFKEITPEMNIYPNWRKWMNENSVSIRLFCELMGLDLSSTNYNNVYGWMRGRCYPTKKNIDRILEATGLTYEQLFYQEETV